MFKDVCLNHKKSTKVIIEVGPMKQCRKISANSAFQIVILLHLLCASKSKSHIQFFKGKKE